MGGKSSQPDDSPHSFVICVDYWMSGTTFLTDSAVLFLQSIELLIFATIISPLESTD
jgi:hypothetical protein